jgi:hypothetical protein
MYKTSKQEQFSIAYARAIAAPLGFNPGKFDVDDDSVDISFTAQYDIKAKIRSPEINIRGIFFEVRILWRKNLVRSQVA